MKKLIENVVKLQLVQNEVAETEADENKTVDDETTETETTETETTETEAETTDFKIQAVVAHTGVVNDNGFLLDGDVIEFKRGTYPFLFNHESSNLLGETKTTFDAEQNAYISDITIYDTKQDIIKAVKNGVYDSVSIAYYIDDWEYEEDDTIIVKHAVMNEVSLVSVGADTEANLVANEFKEERQAYILAKNKLKELKKSYE